MDSKFSPQREKAEDSGNGLPLATGQTALVSELNRTEHYVFLEERSKEKDVAKQADEALQSARLNASAKQVFEAVGGFTVDLDDQEAERLRQMPCIKCCEADQQLELTNRVESATAGYLVQTATALEVPNKTAYKSRVIDGSQEKVKGQQDVEADTLTSYGDGKASSGEILPYGVKAVWGGKDISIRGNVGEGCYAFVIDSGVLATTGDLNLNKEWSRSWVTGESAFVDGNGHGTHVAGTIAALANNRGVVGVAPGAEVISLKIFDSNGGGASFSTCIDAVNYATSVITKNGLNKNKCVINMSLGGGFSLGLDQAIRNSANQGIKFTIAAGNAGSDADFWSPASAGDHPNVYTVSAVDNQYRMASWSNWDNSTGGDDVDVAAPGVRVLSYYKGGNLRFLSGTSMAAPHVAGLLLMGNGKLSEGDMVEANAAGHSDPFALHTSNSAPELIGKKAILAHGKEDTEYIIQESDLLKGFSDPDGDTLQVENLKASAGSLVNNNNGTWTYAPDANDNGTIKLNYKVSDDNGNSLQVTNSFELEAINDAPELIGKKAIWPMAKRILNTSFKNLICSKDSVTQMVTRCR